MYSTNNENRTYQGGGFTLGLINTAFQGSSLARAHTKALDWALKKYSLLYLILYSYFRNVFRPEGPQNCISFMLRKTWIRPCVCRRIYSCLSSVNGV
jgi:hypothetical protein